jgi:photosystem II stability/assembly factor-like uncharacterized protein
LILSLFLGPDVLFAGENIWTTNGPPGPVIVLTIDAVSGNLLAGARASADHDSLFFRSSDPDQSWLALADAPTGLSLAEVMIDPSDPARLCAAVNSFAGPFSIASVYRSDDGGSSWVRVGWVNGAISALAVRPDRPETVFGAGFACYGTGVPTFFHNECSASVFRSVDSAAMWDRVAIRLGGSGIAELVFDPVDRDQVYAAGDGGFFVSGDRGEHWTPMNAGLEGCPSLTSLAVSGNGVLYAGTGRIAFHRFECGGVYRSVDGGETWSPTGLPPHYVTALAIDPENPQMIYAGTARIGFFSPDGGVFRSVDGGDTWISFGLGLPFTGVGGLVIDSGGHRLHAATSEGVFDLEIVPGARPPVLSPRIRGTRVVPVRP